MHMVAIETKISELVAKADEMRSRHHTATDQSGFCCERTLKSMWEEFTELEQADEEKSAHTSIS